MGEAVAPSRAKTLARNPSNAAWLIDALLTPRAGARSPPDQILHRDGIHRVTELRALAAMLREREMRARTCTPRTSRSTEIRTAPLPSLGSPAPSIPHRRSKGLPRPGNARDCEPVDGWLETKGLFAELSVGRGAPGFSATRSGAPSQSCALDPAARRHRRRRARGRRRYVLKKSHDYGGKRW